MFQNSHKWESKSYFHFQISDCAETKEAVNTVSMHTPLSCDTSYYSCGSRGEFWGSETPFRIYTVFVSIFMLPLVGPWLETIDMLYRIGQQAHCLCKLSPNEAHSDVLQTSIGYTHLIMLIKPNIRIHTIHGNQIKFVEVLRNYIQVHLQVTGVLQNIYMYMYIYVTWHQSLLCINQEDRQFEVLTPTPPSLSLPIPVFYTRPVLS